MFINDYVIIINDTTSSSPDADDLIEIRSQVRWQNELQKELQKELQNAISSDPQDTQNCCQIDKYIELKKEFGQLDFFKKWFLKKSN